MKVYLYLKKSITVSLVLFVVLLVSSCASRRSIAIEEGWEMLAERKVNFVRDKDEIEVTSRNEFTALKFRVEEKDVRINDLRIFFENGDKLEPSLDVIISAGQESKLIELGREGRRINKIEFKYRSTGSLLEGRANVLVFARRFNQYRNY